MACELRDFLRKYAQDGELRSDWAEDPAAAGAAEGLSTEQIEVVLSEDSTAIRDALDAEGCEGTYIPAGSGFLSEIAAKFGVSVDDNGGI